MGTRAEAASATRSALTRAASELLDEGGPVAVTLRAVGARAGVSRGAPYGHFKHKGQLLTEIAVDTWTLVADRVEEFRADSNASPSASLANAMLALIEVSRRHPHRYALMFSTPADSLETLQAAGRLEDLFLALVADVVGETDARRYGALVMSSAHGIAALQLSGHLAEDKWDVGGEQLVRMLVDAIRSAVTDADARDRTTWRSP